VTKDAMKSRIQAIRRFAALALLLAAMSATGCQYAKHRLDDALEMFDIGISLSGKPCLSVYACGVSFITGGISKFDGVVVGMGGGFIGIVGHQNECFGLITAGTEHLVWTKGRKKRDYRHMQGWQATLSAGKIYPPAYFPACTHYLHLFYFGLVGNLRYAEMLDFMFGFLGFDMAMDDGRDQGKWFFQ
jgi:hypothetical protein